ncbi:hypothetical protein [Actinomyces qiguomingii]|uniref:hypothetical protein n=1 Tax=Actinomyces qiguomingii TaxID=2057800 RepID=UPI00157FA838|nr:hypothetical protein [Actinomyces qiguomingii]
MVFTPITQAKAKFLLSLPHDPRNPEQAGPPSVEGLTSIIGWVKWTAFAVCILGLFAVGALTVIQSQRDQGGEHVGKIGVDLGGMIVVSLAALLIGLRAGREAGEAVSTTESVRRRGRSERVAMPAVAMVMTLGLVTGCGSSAPNESASVAATTAVETRAVASADASNGSEDADAVGTANTSVCGLPGEMTEKARLTNVPDVDYWDYDGTTAYPVSGKYGPGAIDEESGFRYCFQRSPEGAVFAATNAAVQGANAKTLENWLSYFVADEKQLDAMREYTEGDVEEYDDGGARVQVAGFRLLAYDGDSARVDVATYVTVNYQTSNVSMVYELVWQDGDWKANITDPQHPIDGSTIPSLSGYLTWGT